ncbi:efflux RND transporter periplasmic adaptor subunit [Bythopirellula polymerisocia]|uniref:Macrolide transporter subunit MacA n=1 Tax=Bythopirellula polymerisocia TaxID=2528003 RepID=A0A5C6CQL2_9BACT|nr:HlyD family efflux transporter periplasmic adaptor subunit [Bythopirellula polymerisocia]TWU25731.1 macrolide transporter subunit MacA [Bythopirellula polymerisocia]
MRYALLHVEVRLFQPPLCQGTKAPIKGSIRRGATSFFFMFFLLLLAAGAGGAWWWTVRGDQEGTTDAILHSVDRRDFTLDITERGEIKAGGVTEVKSEVKAKNAAGIAILKIVREGTEVQQGDFLIELDSSILQEELTVQKINYNTAKAVLVESKNMYETAVIALREYLEGTYVQERQVIESEVFVAEENLNRAREYFAYSKKLATKGYVNDLQLEADRFAVEKSQKELDAAKTKLNVIDEFTKAKMVKQLESDIATTKAKWDSAENSFELESNKLADVQDQIAKCTILAPREGTVVYAHERDRGGDNSFIVQEGAVIRERQTIINLPIPDSMEVELTINESLIQFLKVGLPARITPVGFGGRVLIGKVKKINQFAEPTGWRKANVKDYKATVEIESAQTGLRSGMTASVTIKCQEIDDALQVPVQSVYAHGNKFYCLTFDAGKWQARPVVCGPTNDKFYVIEQGLDVGEQVAMNPRRYLDQVVLPKIAPEREQRAVAQGPEAEAEQSLATDAKPASSTASATGG